MENGSELHLMISQRLSTILKQEKKTLFWSITLKLYAQSRSFLIATELPQLPMIKMLSSIIWKQNKSNWQSNHIKTIWHVFQFLLMGKELQLALKIKPQWFIILRIMKMNIFSNFILDMSGLSSFHQMGIRF